MNTLIKYSMFGLALAALAACEDDKDYDIYQKPSDAQFQLSTSSISFAGIDVAAKQIDFTSLVHPTVTVDDDWCTLTLVDYTPRNQYSYLVQPTMTLDERSTTIHILVDGVEQGSLQVSQTPADPGFLGIGWNMGNQLDASSNGVADETCWGNPACTAQTMQGVRAAGFETVRIPVTWVGHIGEAPDYTLESAYLERVATVVGYAREAGLKAIINVMHDDGINSDGTSQTGCWINIKEAAESDEANARMTAQIVAVWTQIAERFKDFDSNLMFESFNEVQDGGWGYGANLTDDGRQYAVLNAWNQAVVNAIRATGGNNASRWIGVPGYAASISYTIDNLVVPADPAGKVAVAIHSYDPYNFCIQTATVDGGTDDWGSDSDKAAIDLLMQRLATAYLSQGVTAYIGEFGCCKRADATKEPNRLAWLKYFSRTARTYGLSLLLWDNAALGGGNESHVYIDHGTGEVLDADAVQAVMDGYNGK